MYRLILLAGVSAFIATSPALAEGKGQGGGGNGGAKHEGGGKHGGGGGGKQGGPAKHAGPAKAPQKNAGVHVQQAKGNGGGSWKAAAAEDRGGGKKAPDRDARQDHAKGNDSARGPFKDAKGKDAGAFVQAGRSDRTVRTSVRYADRVRYPAGPVALIQGCPPGLAKKNNGCLPPGQARKFAGYANPYANWYGTPYWYHDDDRHDWRYSGGYAYRLDRSTSLVSAFLPLLGGALFGGNIWPSGYDNYAVTPYYGRYYGSGDQYDYRYADGAVFAVDPKTQAIQAITGLLTGDSWNVGSAMPSGYDFYNVPPEYRDRYADTQNDWYRYSDGYVYQVDPTTQIVRKAIELLI